MVALSPFQDTYGAHENLVSFSIIATMSSLECDSMDLPDYLATFSSGTTSLRSCFVNFNDLFNFFFISRRKTLKFHFQPKIIKAFQYRNLEKPKIIFDFG